MQNNILQISILLLTLLIASCSNEEKTFQKVSPSPTAHESTEECGKDIHHICNQGLSFVKIGDSLAGLPFTHPSIKSVRDTVIHTEDYETFGKIITVNDGVIVIESSPIEKAEPTCDVMHAHVGTIRVQSALFSTPENIKIGSTFSQLKTLYPDSLIIVEPGDNVGEIELKVPKVTRINYTLQQAKTNNGNPGAEMYEVSQIPSNAKVSAIMIMQ